MIHGSQTGLGSVVHRVHPQRSVSSQYQFWPEEPHNPVWGALDYVIGRHTKIREPLRYGFGNPVWDSRTVALIVGRAIGVHSEYLIVTSVDVDMFHPRSRVCGVQVGGILPSKRKTTVLGFLEVHVLLCYEDVYAPFIQLKRAPFVVSPVDVL